MLVVNIPFVPNVASSEPDDAGKGMGAPAAAALICPRISPVGISTEPTSKYQRPAFRSAACCGVTGKLCVMLSFGNVKTTAPCEPATAGPHTAAEVCAPGIPGKNHLTVTLVSPGLKSRGPLPAGGGKT